MVDKGQGIATKTNKNGCDEIGKQNHRILPQTEDSLVNSIFSKMGFFQEKITM